MRRTRRTRRTRGRGRGGWMRVGRMVVTCAIAMGIATACVQQRDARDFAKRQAAAKASENGVVRIELPHYAPANLPDAPGRDAFTTACLSCHSTRYITMQP